MNKVFGAYQIHDESGNLLPIIEFRVFFPAWGLGKIEYPFNKEPEVEEIKVVGTFQDEEWNEAAALKLKVNSYQGGKLFSARTEGLHLGIYQYCFIITYKNGEKRITCDPHTKFRKNKINQVCRFVVRENELQKKKEKRILFI